jgi:superfamily II DNA or RNA helicase
MKTKSEPADGTGSITAEVVRPSLRDTEYRVFYRPNDNPLETFYLPTLAASVYYDRSAGYFRSSALAAAAAGIVRLIQNDGRMRLLVGAELDEEDVEAIKKGYDLRETLEQGMLGRFPDPSDSQLKQRLEALAWMVANGTLDIKVVLPLDNDGYPIPGPVAQDYYHTKKGIFTDAYGNQVGFAGSINESAQAWKRNFEEFVVSTSWGSDYERSVLDNIRASFNQLWEGQDPHWLAVELPKAVKEKLIKYAPSQPPTTDALERLPKAIAIADHKEGFAAAPPDERLLFQFLRDAPYLPPPAARDLGAQTSGIHPWPHQTQVARTVVDRFPDRVLLCDEVGLGKTIEAGLIIRQLILTGRVKRCLILTPAAVLSQWQEELYEKFNLNIPRFDAGQLVDVRDRVAILTNKPWDTCDLLLASSHLAKRRERVPELLDARPWDLLVVDEAHHARRRDFLQPRYRPNRLLTLLNGLKESGKYQALLLLTATPMQVHPLEVWDLLTVLGLGGRWGADEGNFLQFFGQLRQPFDQANWDLVYDLVADHLGQDGQIDPHFEQAMHQKLGPVLSNAIRELPSQRGTRRATLRNLPERAHPYVREMARYHTPLRRYAFRNTRDLLRKYVAIDLLEASVPWRDPHICRIGFRADEAGLYARITEYISEFYQRYENERRGLGFIMTVYRRRLTSSFYAIRRSLERRRDALRGLVEPDEMLTPEDATEMEELDELEDAEQELFQAIQLTPAQRENFEKELEYLDSFIADLRALSQADSKLTYLKDELERLFRQRPTVIVFTQYTDTMDYLRDQLCTVYGRGVACYSGRGGEIWNGITWVQIPKEQVKNRFRAGELKILLCTESASEGLNLQTCGVLINYDMPWNPMRVEQRIGRIDRIGQEYERVWIFNYFYRDSIEDRIYQALRDRINWFEDVVGDLQPILAAVGEVTRKLAMLPVEEQAAAFEREIRQLRSEIEDARLEALNIADYLDPEQPGIGVQTPLALTDLEAILTKANATSRLFQPHPEIPDAYLLSWADEKVAVTFSADRFDEYPDTLQLLSYGNPLLTQILGSVPPPEEYPAQLIRFADEETLPVCAWYSLHGNDSTQVNTLAQLKQVSGQTTDQASPLEKNAESAHQQFTQQVQAINEAYQSRLAQHTTQWEAALRAKARRLLEKASLVEIALGQQQTLFAAENYPTGFSEAAVAGLKRHKTPWSWMLVIGGKPLPQPQHTDPFYDQIRNEKRETLKALFGQLTAEAKDILQAWRAINP